jgi:hypothetical protein
MPENDFNRFFDNRNTELHRVLILLCVLCVPILYLFAYPHP